MTRTMSKYRVVSTRDLPINGRSWSAKVEIEIECPMDAVLETRVVDIKIRATEARPEAKVMVKPQQLSMEETP